MTWVGCQSFTPNNRKDITKAKRRRSGLIKLFFLYKILSGFSIWFQGYRALFGVPETKMENLPKRYVFVKIKTLLKIFERT